MLKNKNLIVVPKSVKIRKHKDSLILKSNTGVIRLSKKELSQSVLRSNLIGLSVGYSVRLVFNGVGYRIESIVDRTLKIKLGLSHFIFITIPFEVDVVAPKKTSLILKSLNLFVLKSFVSKIRQIGPVDCYKGKGILLKNESVRLKEGKKK